jgi:chromosome segregation ATPase
LEDCKKLYVRAAEDARLKELRGEKLESELSASKNECLHLQDALSSISSEFAQQKHLTATLLTDKDELSRTIDALRTESAAADCRASEERNRLEHLLRQESEETAAKAALLAKLQHVVHEKESQVDGLMGELSSLQQLLDDASQQMQVATLAQARAEEKWHIKRESLESMLESSRCESAAWKAQLEHSRNEGSKLQSELEQVVQEKDCELDGLSSELSSLQRLLNETSAKLDNSQREVSNLQSELRSRILAAAQEATSKDARIAEANRLLDEAAAKTHQLECEVQRLCAKFDTYRAKMEAQLATIIHEHQLKLDAAETEQRNAAAQVSSSARRAIVVSNSESRCTGASSTHSGTLQESRTCVEHMAGL